MKIIEAFSVCDDCMLEIETGEEHDAACEEFRMDREAFIVAHPYLHLHSNDGTPCEFSGPGFSLLHQADENGSLGFCISQCECCSTSLHGERHVMVQLGPEEGDNG